jgi:hypothetical protein
VERGLEKMDTRGSRVCGWGISCVGTTAGFENPKSFSGFSTKPNIRTGFRKKEMLDST